MSNEEKENSKNKKNKSEKKTDKNQEYSKKIGNYVLLCEIGTGTFSKVAKAFHIITDQEVAVKILQKEKIKDEIDIERILREIEILKKVIHPNICQLYETYSTIHNYYLMMEHINGGDLFDYITNNIFLSENKSCKFFRQLISVIEYLNELGISHRDIKPENILLDENHENIKLIDFGLSNYFSEKKLLKSSCGSPCYASPEMLSGNPYLGITTDLWSAGIVLYSMLVGSLPFDDMELYELYKQIKLGKFYLPSTLSLEAIDLLKNILNVDPMKRIGLEGIKKHKWFQMDGYPLYKGINLNKEKLQYNLEVINYVINNYFNKDNDLNTITRNEFIDMIKDYYCNKYTATYYLTKKYILKIDDKDIVFKKDKNEEEINEDKKEKNINLKYDKKICKKNIKVNSFKNEEKNNNENNDKKSNNVKKSNNNLIIKNNINLEIKREEKKKEDYNYDKNDNNNTDKIPNIADDIDKKKLISNAIEEASDKKTDNNNNNNEQTGKKIELNKKQNKNEEQHLIKRNYKKNELYLNNIKNTNLKTHYRNSIEIKQKKFAKNLLLKGVGKTKDNLITNISNNANMNNNNNNSNNSYIIKTWGNNSINHISKNNKIIFNHSGNNKVNNNYLSYNYNLTNSNSNQLPKSKHENNSSINSYKTNKSKKQKSKKKKDKNQTNYNSNNTSYNKSNNISNNKGPLSSSKQKENNFNFYLINNYINQNDSKNIKNNSILNNYNISRVVPNSTKNDEGDPKINFSQYCFIKARKYNMLKTIDLPTGSYTSRYNTEINNKKAKNSNGSLKPYNKIKVNLKTDNNKLSENNTPKMSNNTINKIINKKNSLRKNNNNEINNNSYINKSGNKKNNGIKINEKNQINIENKSLLNCFSVKKENSLSKVSKIMNSNTNTNTNYKNNNNKIQYHLYYLNDSKPNSNNKLATNTSGNALNSNLKNICLKTKGIYLKNHTKKIITRRNSLNSMKSKNNNIILKENTSNNINHNHNNHNMIIRNIGKINKSDIYNKKKITNNSTQKNGVKNYIFKELFPIEEDNNICDIKCHINTKSLKNKILMLNEGYLSNKSNKCNSPKEFYSFNDSGLNQAYHSDISIINKRNTKIKQNFSNIYSRKKNLIIKTEQNNFSCETNSPQSTDKKIKYIYKSKLSLY